MVMLQSHVNGHIPPLIIVSIRGFMILIGVMVYRSLLVMSLSAVGAMRFDLLHPTRASKSSNAIIVGK